MTVTRGWQAIDPEGPCSDPDGHTQNRIYEMASDIPEMIICGNCGESYTMVVFTL